MKKLQNIMKRAWEIAKEAVKRFGGKCREYFSEALRQAWDESKETRFAVKAWFHKNKMKEIGKNVKSVNVFAILKESEKAVQVFVGDNRTYAVYWCPKSCLNDRHSGEQTIFCNNFNKVYRRFVNTRK